MTQYYNEVYFDWQKNIGAFGGWANLIKFEEYITSEMNVIDFGCGGGWLLNNLRCNGKIGIDINDIARQNVAHFGIKSFKYVKDAPDNWADCIISNHALEHVPDPLKQIILLKNKLKIDGKIIFVVPSDRYKYSPNDINRHLYSWSPMNIGNLFEEAGYKVIESTEFIHRWPGPYGLVVKVFGKKLFHIICRFNGYLKRKSITQSRVVAIKMR